MGKDLFMDTPLERLRISEQQIDSINSIYPVFSTEKHPLGWVKLKLVTMEYTNDMRVQKTFYRPVTGYDVFKLYIMLDLMSSLPVSGTFYGRGKKFYNEFLYGMVSGDKYTIPASHTLWDMFWRGISFDTRFLKHEEVKKTEATRDRSFEVKDLTK